MLDTMLIFVNFIKSFTEFTIFLSYNTGKLIVAGLLSTFNVLSKIFNTLWTVFVILNEDLVVFLSDFWNKICEFLGVCNNFTEYVCDTLYSCIFGVKNLIFGTVSFLFTIVQTVTDIIVKVLTGITSFITWIKYLFVLFGSGVWFALTLIPVFIVYSVMMIVYYAGRAFEELQLMIYIIFAQIFIGGQNLITFFVDVPVEAVAGLIICFCLIYSIIKFHVVLYSSVSKIIRYFLNTIRNQVSRLKYLFPARNLLQGLQNRGTAGVNNDSSSSSDESRDENVHFDRDRVNRQIEKVMNGEIDARYCIICMDNMRSILFMPCKHFCTCQECYQILIESDDHCPMCRRYVSYTIPVYV